jgi:hypothetical protein
MNDRENQKTEHPSVDDRSDEAQLAADVRKVLDAGAEAPPFAATFQAAEDTYYGNRRRLAALAAVATLAAVSVAVVVTTTQDAPEADYLQVAELMDGTSWAAPSDVLLPSHEFDIYQELPVLLESTKPAEGALL